MRIKVICIVCSSCGYIKRSLGPIALPAGDLSYWRCFNCGRTGREDGIIPNIRYEEYERVEE